MEDITRHILKEMLGPIILFVLALAFFLLAVLLSGCAANPMAPQAPGVDGPPSVVRGDFEQVAATMDSTAKAAVWADQNATYRSEKVTLPRDAGEDECHYRARVFYASGGGQCEEWAAWFVYCARKTGRTGAAVYIAGPGAHILGLAKEPDGRFTWTDNSSVAIGRFATAAEAVSSMRSWYQDGISFLDDRFEQIPTSDAAAYCQGNGH